MSNNSHTRTPPDNPAEEQQDYIYRMQLNTTLRPEPASGSRLQDLFKLQLRDLLDIMTLYYEGEPVRVDSFAFVSDEDEIYPLYERSEGS